MNVRKVDSTNKHVILNLLQAYEAEFSAITRKLPNESGVFELDTPFDQLHDAYIFYVEKNPCGLAIVGLRNGYQEICEFYVVPSFRGSKLGRELAHSIFDLYKGLWKVKQIAGADKAREFWRKAIGSYKGGAFKETQFSDPYWGAVTMQEFRND